MDGRRSLSRDLARRSEITENLRFVRQTVRSESELKPFAGLDLSNTHLRGLNLSGSVMNRTELQEAVWSFVVFTDASLPHAQLQEATLIKTQFQGADLEGADLAGACWDATTLWGEEGSTQPDVQLGAGCPEAVPAAGG